MAIEENSQIFPGMVVITTQPNHQLRAELTEESPKCKWGARGIVVANDPSGFCDVRHPDGTVARYHPTEISTSRGD